MSPGLVAAPSVRLVTHSVLASVITLNNGNSAPVLRILEYAVVALLWLFFFWVMRSVWVETRAVRSSVSERDRKAEGAPPGAAAAHRDGKGRSLHLRIVDPAEQRDRSFELADELTIGRAAGCGVSIDYDAFTSNLHARVFRRDGEVWVEDLGSTNGTLVNGKRLAKPVRVRKGDHLQVGGTVFEVVR